MDKPMSNIVFRFMTLVFKIRDFVSPRGAVLREAGIRPGRRVLDYGCGPGGYLEGAASLVGSEGRVYALDVHPLAVRAAERIAARKGLANVEAIRSDCATGLADGSLDVVLLYDVFHMLARPDDVLREIHRVLKPEGRLSFSDHHMREADIVSRLTAGGLFALASRGRKTYSFEKTGPEGPSRSI
jgi:ubiquinone/menaquinone biosynthesis C-methylase UbiE